MKLNDSNFLIYAIKKYDNPQCEGMEDLEEDLKRFKYLKRLFRRYEKNGVLSERLIINHLIVLYNVFGNNATELLFFKTDPEHFAILKSFLVYLNRVPLESIGSSEYSDIPLDANILDELRKL
jgi:hypothetical protein